MQEFALISDPALKLMTHAERSKGEKASSTVSCFYFKHSHPTLALAGISNKAANALDYALAFPGLSSQPARKYHSQIKATEARLER